jgi:hypothetical protein
MPPDGSPLDRFYRWARPWARVTAMFNWGFLICLLAGSALEAWLVAGPPLHGLALGALRIVVMWCAIALFLDVFVGRQQERSWGPFLLLVACMVVGADFNTRIWAAPAVCFSLAWLSGLRRIGAGRFRPIAAAAGCGAEFTL